MSAKFLRETITQEQFVAAMNVALADIGYGDAVHGVGERGVTATSEMPTNLFVRAGAMASIQLGAFDQRLACVDHATFALVNECHGVLPHDVLAGRDRCGA